MTAVALLSAGVTVHSAAHHSPRTYDTTSVVRFDGVVRHYFWGNPHVYLLVDSGERTYRVESRTRAYLRRIGWDETSFSSGERVHVVAHPMRRPDGNHRVAPVTITKADGREWVTSRTAARASDQTRPGDGGASR